MALITLSGTVLVLLAVCFTGSYPEELTDGSFSFLQFPKNVSVGTPVVYSYRILYVLSGKQKEDSSKASLFSADKNIHHSKIKDLKTTNLRDRNFPGNARSLSHFLTTAVVGIKYLNNANGTDTSRRSLSKYLTRKRHGNEVSRLGDQVVLKERRKRHASREKPFSMRNGFEHNAVNSHTNVLHDNYYYHYFKSPGSGAQHQGPGDSVSNAAAGAQYEDRARRERYGTKGLQSDSYNPSTTHGSDDIRRAHRFERSPTSFGDNHYDPHHSDSSSYHGTRYDDDKTPEPLSSRRKRMSQYSDANDYNRNSYLSRQPDVSQTDDRYAESFRSGHDKDGVSQFRTEYSHNRRDGYQNTYEGFKNTDTNHYDNAHSTEAETYGNNDNVRRRHPYDINRNYNSIPTSNRYSRSSYDQGYSSNSNPSYNSYRREDYSHRSEPYDNRRQSENVYKNNRFETVRNANDYRAYEDSGRDQNDISGRYSYNSPSYEPRYSSHRARYAAKNYSPRDYYAAENDRTPRYETGYEQTRHSQGYVSGDRDSGYGLGRGIDDSSHDYSTSRDQRQSRRYNERHDDYYNRYFTSPPRQPYHNENERTRDYPTEQAPAYPDTVFNDAYLPPTQRNFRRPQSSPHPLAGERGSSGRPYEYRQHSRRFQQFVRNAKDPGKTMDVNDRNQNAEKLKQADGKVEESFAGIGTDSISSSTGEAMPGQSINDVQAPHPVKDAPETPLSDFNHLLSDVQNNESGYTAKNRNSGIKIQTSRPVFEQIPASWSPLNRPKSQGFINFASRSVSSPHTKYPMKKFNSGIPVIQKHIVDKGAPNLEQIVFDNTMSTIQRLDTEGSAPQSTANADSSRQNKPRRQHSDRDIQHSGLEDPEIPYHTTDSQYTLPQSDDKRTEPEQTSRLGYNPTDTKLFKGSSKVNPNRQHALSVVQELGPETRTSEHVFSSKPKDNYLSKDNENLSRKEKAKIRNIEISQNRIIPRLKRQSSSRLSAVNSVYTAGGHLGGRHGSAESSAINYGYGGPQFLQSYPGRNYPSLSLVPNNRGFQGSSGSVPQFASPHGQLDPHQRNDPYTRGYSAGLSAYDTQPSYPYSAYSDHQGSTGSYENSGQKQSYGSQTHQNPYNDGDALQAQGGYDSHGLSTYNLPQASSSYHPAAYQSSSSAPYSDARDGRGYGFQPSGSHLFAGGQRSPIAQFGSFQADPSGETGSRGQAYYPQSQPYNSGYASSSLANDPNNRYISTLPYPYLSSGQAPYQQGPNTFTTSGYHSNAYTGQQQSHGLGNTRFQNGRGGFSRNEQQSSYFKNPQYQRQSPVYVSPQYSHGGQYPFALAKTKNTSEKHFSTSSKDFSLRREKQPVSKFSNFPTESYGQGINRQNVMASSASKIQNRAIPRNGLNRFSRIIPDLSMSQSYGRESNRYRTHRLPGEDIRSV